MERVPITEEQGLQKQWKEDAREIKTQEELTEFVRHLTEDFEHDYGTIVHAIAAAMTATYSMMNHSDQGGITGFQASCLAWEMVNVFMGNAEGGRRILKMEDLLYPQMASKFTTISPETAEWIQTEAKKRLVEIPDAHPNVIAHWEKVAAGEIPFGLTVEAD